MSEQVQAAGGVGPGEASCSSCGAPLMVAGRSRRAAAPSDLCLSCDRRTRRSAYFRTYYEVHRDRILDKNRKWARDNRDRLVQLRRARQLRKTRAQEEPRRCLDCGEVVVRALRCRRCYTRFRYATDPVYRLRRLATTRRWLERRRGHAPEASPGAGTATGAGEAKAGSGTDGRRRPATGVAALTA